ncbi:myb-like protein X [Tigriopus californicus]|uniref:myb-like protein X n=1 Tax=Tigriopus californicus TaxID=6832 RepID=UPI0027DA92C9|nr:myb-like protein X [Tigriopus californicus]
MLSLAEKKDQISDLSRRVETVLLFLLSENESLKEQINQEQSERISQNDTLESQLKDGFAKLTADLNGEIKIREFEGRQLRDDLKRQGNKQQEDTDRIGEKLEQERFERVEQARNLNDFFTAENEDRKTNLEDVNAWIQSENDLRKREAEALQERLEREKQELRDYMEKDSKDMKTKLNQEEELRRKKEEEIQEQLKEQEQARENEIIQLYKRMAKENIKREEEIDELRSKLEKEKRDLRAQMEHDNQDMLAKLNQENLELKDALKKDKLGLQGEIDVNKYSSNNQIADLDARLKQLVKDSGGEMQSLLEAIGRNQTELKSLINQPLSVYFDAYRTEDYLDGGEQYLTFSKCQTNLGNGFQPESGVFSAPKAGAYLFIIHVCTHDMKKALMTIHKNQQQVASFYDQNHESNHRNSMAGQSVLIDLEVGDRVQVYMFIDTGLQDKRSNHLTHFIGLFLRPKDFITSEHDIPPSRSLTNGC